MVDSSSGAQCDAAPDEEDVASESSKAPSTAIGDKSPLDSEDESDNAAAVAVAAGASPNVANEIPSECEHLRVRYTDEWPAPKDWIQTNERLEPRHDHKDLEGINERAWTYAYNERMENGNSGWAFGNGGARSKIKERQEHLDKVLKRSPAIILGLAECDETTESVLRAPGEPQTILPAEPGKRTQTAILHARQSFEFSTIRGRESSSILLGIRKHSGSLKLLDFTRTLDGTYRSGNSNDRKAFTRAMIVEFSTHNHVQFLGHKHVAMVVHLHFQTAKNMPGFSTAKSRFFDWMRAAIRKYDVKIVMGDFNMALFQVVPELRKVPDLDVDLGAFFPWKTFDGDPACDSCGIFTVQLPGLYHLATNMDRLNRTINTEYSLFIHAKDKFQKTTKDDGHGWPRFTKNDGPGQELTAYRPQPRKAPKDGTKQPPHAQISESLEPSAGSKYKQQHVSKGYKTFFRAKQLALDYEGFVFTGEGLQTDASKRASGHQKGAHYPLCLMTQGHGCRHPSKHHQRNVRNTARLIASGKARTYVPVERPGSSSGSAVAADFDDGFYSNSSRSSGWYRRPNRSWTGSYWSQSKWHNQSNTWQKGNNDDAWATWKGSRGRDAETSTGAVTGWSSDAHVETHVLPEVQAPDTVISEIRTSVPYLGPRWGQRKVQVSILGYDDEGNYGMQTLERWVKSADMEPAHVALPSSWGMETTTQSSVVAAGGDAAPS